MWKPLAVVHAHRILEPVAAGTHQKNVIAIAAVVEVVKDAEGVIIASSATATTSAL